MKIFDIQYQNQKVVDAYSIVNEVLQSRELHERILNVRKFTYTKENAHAVAYALALSASNILSENHPPIPVKEWWYSSVDTIATTFAGDRSIYINANGINIYTMKTLIINGGHEFGHSPMGFGHGSNFNQDTMKGRMMCRLKGEFDPKSESVPHKLGFLVYEVAKEKRLVRQ